MHNLTINFLSPKKQCINVKFYYQFHNKSQSLHPLIYVRNLWNSISFKWGYLFYFVMSHYEFPIPNSKILRFFELTRINRTSLVKGSRVGRWPKKGKFCICSHWTTKCHVLCTVAFMARITCKNMKMHHFSPLKVWSH